jgi:hypothetical protein
MSKLFGAQRPSPLTWLRITEGHQRVGEGCEEKDAGGSYATESLPTLFRRSLEAEFEADSHIAALAHGQINRSVTS